MPQDNEDVLAGLERRLSHVERAMENLEQRTLADMDFATLVGIAQNERENIIFQRRMAALGTRVKMLSGYIVAFGAIYITFHDAIIAFFRAAVK